MTASCCGSISFSSSLSWCSASASSSSTAASPPVSVTAAARTALPPRPAPPTPAPVERGSQLPTSRRRRHGHRVADGVRAAQRSGRACRRPARRSPARCSASRGRTGITNETWDDLEEALLRADVGVRVTDELLGGLRARVKAKEITEPGQLLAALQAEMTSSPGGRRPFAAPRARRARQPQRVAVRRRQRRRQDHHHRQGFGTAAAGRASAC